MFVRMYSVGCLCWGWSRCGAFLECEFPRGVKEHEPSLVVPVGKTGPRWALRWVVLPGSLRGTDPASPAVAGASSLWELLLHLPGSWRVAGTSSLSLARSCEQMAQRIPDGQVKSSMRRPR